MLQTYPTNYRGDAADATLRVWSSPISRPLDEQHPNMRDERRWVRHRCCQSPCEAVFAYKVKISPFKLRSTLPTVVARGSAGIRIASAWRTSATNTYKNQTVKCMLMNKITERVLARTRLASSVRDATDAVELPRFVDRPVPCLRPSGTVRRHWHCR